MQMDEQTKNPFDTVKGILETQSNHMASLEARNRSLESTLERIEKHYQLLLETERKRSASLSNHMASLQARNRSLESREEHYQLLEKALQDTLQSSSHTVGVLTSYKFVANNQKEEEEEEQQNIVVDQPVIERNEKKNAPENLPHVQVVSDSHRPSNNKISHKRKVDSPGDESKSEQLEDSDLFPLSDDESESDSEEAPIKPTKAELDKRIKALSPKKPKKTKEPKNLKEIAKGWKRIHGKKDRDGKSVVVIRCSQCKHEVNRPSRTFNHDCPAKLITQPTAALVRVEPMERSALEGTLVNEPGKQSI